MAVISADIGVLFSLAYWRDVLHAHRHRWRVLSANDAMERYLYGCSCGLRYIDEPGAVTHYTPDGRIIRVL